MIAVWRFKHLDKRKPERKPKGKSTSYIVHKKEQYITTPTSQGWNQSWSKHLKSPCFAEVASWHLIVNGLGDIKMENRSIRYGRQEEDREWERSSGLCHILLCHCMAGIPRNASQIRPFQSVISFQKVFLSSRLFVVLAGNDISEECQFSHLITIGMTWKEESTSLSLQPPAFRCNDQKFAYFQYKIITSNGYGERQNGE